MKSPEEIARSTLVGKLYGVSDRDIRELAEQIRAALAARDAEWREAVNTPHVRFHADEPCDWCAPLRALLSEGKPEGHDGK